MNYSIEQLSLIADCDHLLTAAVRIKSDLANRLYSLNRRRENTGETSNSIEGEIASLVAQIGAYEGFVPTLPEGKAKDDMVINIVNLKHRLFGLNNRSKNFGLIAAIELEYDINVMEENIAGSESYIAQLTAKKATLVV